MKFVQPFSSFLNESTTDWRDFKSWKILEKFGYKEIEETKRGNLIIENKNGVRYVLTPTGYIRDPLRYGTSNSIVENYKHLIDKHPIFDVFFVYFLNKDLGEIETSAPSLLKDAKKEIEDFLVTYIKDPSLTPEQNYFLASYVVGDWNYDSKTGLVNIEGDLTPIKKKNPIISSNKFNLKTLEGLKFGNVSGNFRLSQSSFPTKKFPVKSLGDLVQKVDGDFTCYDLGLTTLEDSPKFVGGDFICDENPLKSLKGAPKFIGGRFVCDDFEIPQGKWGMDGWIEIFFNPSVRDKDLVLTLMGSEEINQMLMQEPEKTIMTLKKFWNYPEFSEIRKEIKIPERYEGELETISDLSDLGF